MGLCRMLGTMFILSILAQEDGEFQPAWANIVRLCLRTKQTELLPSPVNFTRPACEPSCVGVGGVPVAQIPLLALGAPPPPDYVGYGELLNRV